MEKKLTEIFSMRFAKLELLSLKQRAKRNKQSISDYIRLMLDKGENCKCDEKPKESTWETW